MHWNFFFTMGLLPVFGAAFERLSPKVDFHAMALTVTSGALHMRSSDTVCGQNADTYFLAVHQILLSRTSLQDWTLGAARTTLVSQNKEGLVSLPGVFPPRK